jgi:hypothetical protein
MCKSGTFLFDTQVPFAHTRRFMFVVRPEHLDGARQGNERLLHLSEGLNRQKLIGNCTGA